MKSKMSETCKHLIIGIIVLCILFMIVGGTISFYQTGNWLRFILGVLLGGIIASILARHMDYSISNALDRDSDGATKYTRKMAGIRFLIMIVALLLAMTFSSIFNIIGVLLGIMALKFSAYAQPLTSKYISIINKGR